MAQDAKPDAPLSGRVALVTGGSRGLGREMVLAFADAGADVVVASRKFENCKEVAAEVEAKGRRALPIACHVGHWDEMDRLVDQAYDTFGHVDVLVNNAGINPIQPLESVSAADWARTLQVNLTAPLQLLQGFAPGMRQAGWGRVVNISSIWSYAAKPGRAAYSAAKTALNGLTRAAAVELAPHGVLVNAVCPGFVETDLTRANNSPEQLEAIRRQIPLGRLALPGEIAAFVAYLCSDANTYLTGQAILIDGGFTSQ